MNKYALIETNDEKHKVIIFLTSGKSTLYDESLNAKLREMKLPACKVIFDRLLVIGNTCDRYMEAFFDKEKLFYFSNRSVEIDKKHPFRVTSFHFLRDNPNLLNNSTLSAMQIDMLRKGFVL